MYNEKRNQMLGFIRCLSKEKVEKKSRCSTLMKKQNKHLNKTTATSTGLGLFKRFIFIIFLYSFFITILNNLLNINT